MSGEPRTTRVHPSHVPEIESTSSPSTFGSSKFKPADFDVESWQPPFAHVGRKMVVVIDARSAVQSAPPASDEP